MTLKTAIETIKPRQFLRIESVSPRGSLEVRKAAKDGITFYYRFTHEGKPDRVQIGLYDKLAPPKSVNPTKQGYGKFCTQARSSSSRFGLFYISAQQVVGQPNARSPERGATLHFRSASQPSDQYHCVARLRPEGRASRGLDIVLLGCPRTRLPEIRE